MIMQERGHARGRGMKNLAGGAFIPAETGGGGERSSGERTRKRGCQSHVSPFRG